MQNKAISRLLSDTRHILKHSRQLQQIKGETFNIFSVLSLETAENRTHSAFLAELLNPKGSHLMGYVFLKLFFKHLNLVFNAGEYSVVTEKIIGPRDDVKKTGGRIDIIITDSTGQTICIENKIWAGDQYAQIERYCNFNKGKNRVYYLTLEGKKPNKDSAGNKIAGSDFHLISYRQNILSWLIDCQKETVAQPILRETIRQYILLIYKLTGIMENREEEELQDLLLRNYAEARVIADKADAARRKLGSLIQQGVYKRLTELLKDDKRFIIEMGSDATAPGNFAQVWIFLSNTPVKDMRFGIESFTGVGHEGGRLYTGVFNARNTDKSFGLLAGNTIHIGGWWFNLVHIEDVEGCPANLNNPVTILQLHTNPVFQTKFIEQVAQQTCTYVCENYQLLASFLKIPATNG